jgi:hypothetical protein
MPCQYITASRPTPFPSHQCKLIADVVGPNNSWVGDKFAKDCTGDDKTSSPCAQCINRVLYSRVCHPMGTDTVATLKLIISRQGKAAAEGALLEAVKLGMPVDVATALAVEAGLTT